MSCLGDVLEGVGGGDEVEAHGDKEGEDTEEINDVEEGGEELKLVWGYNQSGKNYIS